MATTSRRTSRGCCGSCAASLTCRSIATRRRACALEIATQQWSRELQSIPERALRGAVLRDTSFHVVEISLMKAPAGPDKDRLERIPTALRASPDDVATLRKFVLQTVRADPQWQRLLHELQPPASTSARQTGAHVD